MDELDPTDRRTHPRILTPYRIALSAGPVGGALAARGYLMDLSREGACVRFLGDQDLVTLERLRFELPEWLGMGEALEVSGRFVWFRPPSQGQGPVGGFAFDPLPERERRHLDRLLEGILQAAEQDGLLDHAMAVYAPSTDGSSF